jgi:hypothetical protein
LIPTAPVVPTSVELGTTPIPNPIAPVLSEELFAAGVDGAGAAGGGDATGAVAAGPLTAGGVVGAPGAIGATGFVT